MKIENIAVLGANGTMGAGMAGIFASFGQANVYLFSRNIEDACMAKEKAASSVRAQAISKNMFAETYDNCKEIIEKCDLIYESVAENYEIKEKIYEIVNKFAKPEAIIASNTSGLSINRLSNVLTAAHQKRFLGIHCSNPPYVMSMCEVIYPDCFEKSLKEPIEEYLSTKLLRNVVVVNDTAAFLINRIGFEFMNALLKQAALESEKGGIDYIDAIFGQFTGRNMPPLSTLDLVGLDVHKAIVDNVYLYTCDYNHEYFALPAFAQKLIDKNFLGRKTKKGLYSMQKDLQGNKTLLVYDIKNDIYRKVVHYDLPFISKICDLLQVGEYRAAMETLVLDDTYEAKICLKFLIMYVCYSIFSAMETGGKIANADVVIATGLSWIPPLSLIQAFGGVECFKQIANKYGSEDDKEKIFKENLLENLPTPEYDYRPFLKANRGKIYE